MPRLNFEISEQKLNELKELQQETGSPTMKDLFNGSVTTLQWLIAEVKKGKEIVSFDESRNSFRVLVTPILETVAYNARQASVKAGSIQPAAELVAEDK